MDSKESVSGEAGGPLNLKVKYAERLMQPSDDVYDTTTNPPGRVLLLTYLTFLDPFSDPFAARFGGEIDARNLVNLFRQMGYDVESHRDRTRAESLSLLEDFSSPERLSKVGSAIVSVSSHGGAGSFFFTSDGEKIFVNEVHDVFNKSRNKNVREMPKLFFFSFSRGSLLPKSHPADRTNRFFSTPEQFVRKPEPNVVAPENMISFFSTPEGFVSFRNSKKGSGFISEWCEVLAESAWEDSLDDLSRKVQRRYMNSELGSTLEEQRFAFQKKFYFNPRNRKQ